jgi:hypothetical protein
MRTKAEDMNSEKKKPPNPELDAFKAQILKVLEYYGDEHHYDPFNTPGGPRGPGVPTDHGELARKTIRAHWPAEDYDHWLARTGE